MENVPPSSMNHCEDLPSLDDLLPPKRNVKSSRQKRSPGLNTRTNADREDEDSLTESGLLTPPSSQTQEEDMDPSRMLFSPPPEEILRHGRGSTARARSVPIQQPFTPSLLVDPPTQSTALSKRKRNAHNRSSSHTALDSIINNEASSSSVLVTEATPNPKPRKQTKHGSPSRRTAELEEPTTPTRASSQRRSESPTKRTLFLSPHHTNPNADYVPPLPTISRQSISARRRSSTPMPPYEPPRERFTPPREIIHTPPRATVSPERISKSSKRKSTAPKNQKKLVLTVKKEPPEIDLSVPPPPPSPSDDPLLLKGLPGHPKSRPRPSKLQTQQPASTNAPEALGTPASTHARETPSIASSSASPPETRVGRLPDLNSSLDFGVQNGDDYDDDDDDSFAGAPPIFDLTNPQEDPGAWDDVDSGSDSDDFDQTGEYTGRFKVLTVPTKADPPSSCTRSRQDAWGNPSSPFPGSGGKRRSLPSSSSPPLKAVPDGEDGAQSESLDEDDVFFLNTPASADVRVDVTVREEFEEGSSRDAIDGLAGLEVDLSVDVPDVLHTSHEQQDTFREGPREKSPSPLPIVDVQGEEYGHEHHVRFVAPRGSPEEDVSMELEDGDDSQGAPQPHVDADFSYESVIHDPEDDQARASAQEPEREAAHDSDSSDEETVDRELSREPGQFSDDEYEEERDTRPKPPTIPTPPRATFTPARSVSPNEQTARPKGFLSITSPLRRRKSPPVQGSQAGYASPMLSIDAAFATLVPVVLREPQEGEGVSTRPLDDEAEEDLMEEDQPAEQVATDIDDDSADESEELDEGVVKITSDDPRVAARAAAILKMHDYDFIIRDPSRKRRYSGVDSALRKARRRSTLEGGIAKHGTPVQRRRTLGGIIGDKVIIPGSPMMTVPELLQQAEQTVEQRERSMFHTPSRDASFISAGESASFKFPLPLDRPVFETPEPRQKVYARPTFNASGPRAWEKDDWKLLDACFTDERLSLGSHKRLGEATLASVDVVDLDKVVNRFLEYTGGVPVEECWPGWTRDDLLRRTLALQKKQRAGKGAPPTPSGRFGSVALSEVPDFTPLPSRQSSVQPGLQRWASTSSTGSSKPAVPASLLAPRYSHLLDEAIAIWKNEFRTPTASTAQPVEYRSASVPVAETREISLPPQSPATAMRSESEAPMNIEDVSMSMPPPPLPTPRSITSRMKGFLFSYLPKATKSNRFKKPAAPAHPGLPIPPPEVFQKPRSVATPVSKPAPKPVPPKDLVNLHHAPLPPSKIPRPTKQQPKRLVELHPAPPPEPRPASSTSKISLSDRRSSSGSVKDLVKGFEDLQKMQAREKQEEAARLRRVRSVGEWAAATGSRGRGQQDGKPGWKP
ncbi:hypothetical protein BD311DRAFT_766713 [Dichomitus squalens]|uniref:Uncharacterized protein n=1 Tax=Dichomitus squalens TaxID=114155 RepID=A0A4Q9MEU8_9APHY|nr:hypothetical protein BD311DRAFT_766713 [Dichomitus squalens]